MITLISEVLAGTAATVAFCFGMGYTFGYLVERERQRRNG